MPRPAGHRLLDAGESGRRAPLRRRRAAQKLWRSLHPSRWNDSCWS